MAHIISICNQKGGVGKTTTSVSLAACLAAAERKTLLIDLDPQGNATSGLGHDKDTIDRSIYDLLIGRAEPQDVILKTDLTSLEIIPSNTDLAGAEVELVGMLSREMRLKQSIKTLRDQYDYIIIDCPPSLGLLTLNAMSAADSLIIPVQCEYYAMEGMASLFRTVQLVRSHLNPNLNIRGIVMTMFDKRNNLSNQVVTEIRRHFAKDVFEVVIPRNVKLSEAPSYGQPIILYDLESTGAQSYFALASEVIALDRADEEKKDAQKNEVAGAAEHPKHEIDDEDEITAVTD